MRDAEAIMFNMAASYILQKINMALTIEGDNKTVKCDRIGGGRDVRTRA